MGFFDNAESVFIEGKEVESIIVNSNNAVLYQRADPVITLTGVDNSSLSTCNLEATLTLRGVPLVGRTVYFLANGVNVGSAVTNSNGVASYSYNYSGVSGNVNMTASYGSFLSETYVIQCSLLYENSGNTLAGIDTQNNIIYETPSSGTFSIYTDGTNIHVPYGRYGSCIWPITTLDNISSFRVEFDSYEYDYDSFSGFGLYDSVTGHVMRFGYFMNCFITMGLDMSPGAWTNVGGYRSQWIHNVIEITPSTYYYAIYTSGGSLIYEQSGTHNHPNLSASKKGLNSGYNRGLDDILYKNIVVTRL